MADTTGEPIDSPGFHVGWHRVPGGRWRQVCEGATHGEAMQALLRAEVPSGEMWVGPAGQHPNGGPAPIAKGRAMT